jgi:hypothetical protein
LLSRPGGRLYIQSLFRQNPAVWEVPEEVKRAEALLLCRNSKVREEIERRRQKSSEDWTTFFIELAAQARKD